ncbi:MAG: FAD:protein FMN transferase [Akkermansiaceae bacterium]|jgi:thiamine biosynthesis lipoprotein|nr:FAD:protein FMN transferase [Akkermansiaceae bacterium]
MFHRHHEAMNTTFHLRLPEGLRHASDMALECFEELDRLEGKLSRYREDSDISRVNSLAAGETIYLCEETHRCLCLAFDLHERTGGLFDVTLGRAIRHRKDGESGPLPQSAGKLMIHPADPAVTCLEPGRELDLGGIGKGFALDHLREVLLSWDAPEGLLSAGASTHLGFGDRDWPIELSATSGSHSVALRNASLSSSGTAIQGSHIVHPDPDAPLAEGRAWIIARSGAVSDAWSTALLLSPIALLAPWLAADPDVTGAFIETDGLPMPFPF